MSPSFWRAIDLIGSAPVAAVTWRTVAGTDESQLRPFLRRTRNHALTVIDPDSPHRSLDLYPDKDLGFVALAEDRPPLFLNQDDVRETRVDLEAIRGALAHELAFVPSAQATPVAPLIHQIGIVQPSRSRALPVMLMLPAGLPTDRANYVRGLSTLSPCVLYVPTARWQTADAFDLAAQRGISIEALDQHFASTASPTAPLAVAAQERPGSSVPQPIIRVQSGWRWEDIRIRLTTRGTLIAAHRSERGEHRFVKSGEREAVRRFPTIFRMLIEISFTGYWQNPPPTSRTYDKVSKSFTRLRQTIETLIPIPAAAFVREKNRWRPRFRIELDDEMESSARRYLRTSTDDDVGGEA